MLETGLVQRLAPREFYALHCSPFPSGTIGVSPGYGLPGLDHIRILLPSGGDATVAALAAEVAQLGNVEFPGDPVPAMVNSAQLSTAAGRHLSARLGPQPVVWARASWPFNCEDFALFLNEAPGAQFYLGVADPETGMNGAPHTPDFAADERAIGHGVRAMTSLLIDRLGELARQGGERP